LDECSTRDGEGRVVRDHGRRGQMNLVPLLVTALDDSLPPPDDLALDLWREQWEDAARWFGGPWSLEDAVSWVRESPALSELLQPRSFDALVDTGPGVVRLSAAEADRGWASPPNQLHSAWENERVWDEAVELADGSFLAYPNDAGSPPNLAFYAPVPPADPIPLPTLVLELSEPRVFNRIRLRDDADGKCARYLVRSQDGARELSCERLTCPNECVRRAWVDKGGIRRARCAC
jgi:hypothetical protein